MIDVSVGHTDHLTGGGGLEVKGISEVSISACVDDEAEVVAVVVAIDDDDEEEEAEEDWIEGRSS